MIDKRLIQKLRDRTLVLVALASIFSAAVQAEVKNFQIESQSLASALNRFSEQADITIIAPSELVKGVQATALQGSMEIEQALQTLLADTGLRYEFTAQNAVVVKAAKKKPELARQSVKNDALIEEIVVTAQKREQNLQDIPVAVSALSADTIEKRGLKQMADYLSTIPGVTMQERGAGTGNIVIRGIGSSPQFEVTPTGVYFGETPISRLTTRLATDSSGNGDMRMVDINRVEVLRGPQGTLWGSGSMGGAVRVIPNSPNLTEMEGKIVTGYSYTRDGDNNTDLEAVFNLPLVSDRLAVRSVAYRIKNGGYVDNVAASQTPSYLANPVSLGAVVRDKENVGGDETEGVRLSALWQVTDNLDITLAFSRQVTEQDGQTYVDLDLRGEYSQAQLQTGPGGVDKEFVDNELGIQNLTVNYDLGWGSITSATSRVDFEASSSQDVTLFFGVPFSFEKDMENKILFEELRFVSDFDGPLQVLAGLYYEKRETFEIADLLWSGDPSLGSPLFIDLVYQDATEKQKAFFGELEYSITERLKATFGMRHFDYDQDDTATSLSGQEDGQTYKVNLAYQFAPDVMVYGQWAEGFRMGQPLPSEAITAACDANNDGLLDGLGIPAPDMLESDLTENFEIGLKAALVDGRVTLDGAIYQIDWEGIPVTLTDSTCGFGISANAGTAKSKGIEVAMRVQLLDSLLMDISGSYGMSELTSNIPNVSGFGGDGDPLPGSADFNFSFGLEHQFVLSGHDAFARMDYAYVGEFFNNFLEEKPAAGDYHQLHVKAGINLGNVDLDFFGKNLTNADDLTAVENVYASLGSRRAFRLRPRTVGLNLAYTF